MRYLRLLYIYLMLIGILCLYLLWPYWHAQQFVQQLQQQQISADQQALIKQQLIRQIHQQIQQDFQQDPLTLQRLTAANHRLIDFIEQLSSQALTKVIIDGHLLATNKEHEPTNAQRSSINWQFKRHSLDQFAIEFNHSALLFHRQDYQWQLKQWYAPNLIQAQLNKQQHRPR